MAPNLQALQARSGQRTLLLTTAAVPLAGWTVHAATLYRRLAHDPHTGLLRRSAFDTRASRILRRHGDNAFVLLVDLDHFKRINDTLGHAAGDAVLVATASRLESWAGAQAAVGRIGGDEFAVALKAAPAHRGERLAELMHMLHAPVALKSGQQVPTAASVGAAEPGTLGVRDLSQLKRAADAALYQGKHSGRAALAAAQHVALPSVNGRRLGHPGTATWGRAA